MRRLAILAVLVSALALAPVAQAVPITGNVGFGGDGAPLGTPGNWNTATGVDFFNPWRVNQATGAYLVTNGYVGVNFTDITWGSASGLVNIPLSQRIWEMSFGGLTYRMDAGSIMIIERGTLVNNIAVSGTGILSISGGGWDPTPGTWNFTGGYTGTSQNLSFSSTPIPDASSSLLLLGMGLVGLRMWRKR